MKILLVFSLFVALIGIKILSGFCPKHDITILVLDSEFEKHYIVLDNEVYTEKQIIIEAVKYWNDFGANFILPDALYSIELNNNYHSLKINRSNYAVFGILGRYNVVNGNITLFPKYWKIKHYPINTIRCIIAHELGHSLGLWHLNNKDSVMYKHPASLDKLSKYDIEEFKNSIF